MTIDKSLAFTIISKNLLVPTKEAEVILSKAEAGGEFFDNTSLDKWLKERFLPNIVFIDEDSYTKMLMML